MKLRELIKGRIVIDDASIFAGCTVDRKNTSPPELYIGIYNTDASRELYSIDLTREAAQKIIDELIAALAVPAPTPGDVSDHLDFLAYRKEKEYPHG